MTGSRLELGEEVPPVLLSPRLSKGRRAWEGGVNHGEASVRKSKMVLCSNAVFSLPVPPPGGQPDPDPRGEGDPGGVGPVPAALRPLHALHPGGAGRVHHLLLRAPALPPTHEGEAGQPGNRHQHRCHRDLSGETHPSQSEPIRRLEHAAEP